MNIFMMIMMVPKIATTIATDMARVLKPAKQR